MNLATGIVALCTILVVGVQVPKTLVSPKGSVQVSDTTTVTNWRDYSLEGVRMGPATAAITIVEFADFQCSFCESAARYLSDLRDRYPRSVAVVYRHFPFHEFAMSAAIASQCAAEVGSFEAFHDLIYSTHDAIGEKPWAAFARDAGVSDSLCEMSCDLPTGPSRWPILDLLRCGSSPRPDSSSVASAGGATARANSSFWRTSVGIAVIL